MGHMETDPAKVAEEGINKFKKEKFDIIIVDTSGRHHQEEELFQEMIEISNVIKPNQTIMVLDASIGQAAEQQSKAFKESSDFGAIILTKMDGHARGVGQFRPLQPQTLRLSLLVQVSTFMIWKSSRLSHSYLNCWVLVI